MHIYNWKQCDVQSQAPSKKFIYGILLTLISYEIRKRIIRGFRKYTFKETERVELLIGRI